MIRTAHINLLEGSTVSLALGTEDAACPLYRLYDRDTLKPFKGTLVETVEILVDQGSQEIEKADTLIIASGHNLDGVSLALKHSDDNIVYNDALAPWTGTAGVMALGFAEVVKRYFKLVITSPASAPSLTEVFITKDCLWERLPSRPSGLMEDAHSVTRMDGSGGSTRSLVLGPPRRRRSYSVSRMPLAMKDEMLSLWRTWGKGKGFWLMDHEGSWIYGGLEAGLDMREVAHESYSMGFQFREAL